MKAAFPDGVSPPARSSGGGVRRFLPLAILVAIAVFGLSGRAGGGPPEMVSADNAQVSVAISQPGVLRSGEFFERRVEIHAREPIDELSVSFPSSLHSRVTLNSTLPQPDGEQMTGEEYSLTFGALAAGESAVLQTEMQVNSNTFGRRTGDVVVRDGDAELARIPVKIAILP